MEGSGGRYSLSTALDWSYGGVNSSIPGNGGPDCAGFLTPQRRVVETLVASCIGLLYICYGWSCITWPATLPFVRLVLQQTTERLLALSIRCNITF